MKLLLIFLIFIGSSQLVKTQDLPANQFKKAEAKLQELVEQKKCVGLAAGIFQGATIQWTSAQGYQDAAQKINFSPHTVSRIASITKPMTAIALLQLYEQGKVDLDAPIQKYLPDFPKKPEGVITCRQLLGHSSGIDAYASKKEVNNQKNYKDLQAAIENIQGRDLVAPPGSQFHYTSYGYVVLGRIIEKVSGLGFEAYLKKNIWEPAGMDHTSIEKFAETVAHKAQIYHKDKKGKIRPESFTNLSDRLPGGGVQSTLEDLLKFGQAVLNHRLIKAETLDMMIKNQGLKKEGNGYGLGWYLYGINPRYGNVFGHNGSQLGASAFLFLLPEQKAGVVTLSNTSGTQPEMGRLAVELFSLLAVKK